MDEGHGHEIVGLGEDDAFHGALYGHLPPGEVGDGDRVPGPRRSAGKDREGEHGQKGGQKRAEAGRHRHRVHQR